MRLLLVKITTNEPWNPHIIIHMSVLIQLASDYWNFIATVVSVFKINKRCMPRIFHWPAVIWSRVEIKTFTDFNKKRIKIISKRLNVQTILDFRLINQADMTNNVWNSILIPPDSSHVCKIFCELFAMLNYTVASLVKCWRNVS